MPGRTESIIPVPDPSRMTTEQLDARLGALKDMLTARLDGMDKAIVVLSHTWEKVPIEIDSHIDQLSKLVLEKFATVQEQFASIQTQFKERDIRVESSARDTKVAVDAALQAAEKAVGKQTEAFSLSIAKSETVTSKQIDQQGQLIATMTSGLSGQIVDVKERLSRMESEAKGQADAVNNRQASTSSNVGIIGLIVVGLIGLIGIVVNLVTHFSK
jgi:hypothetical protein